MKDCKTIENNLLDYSEKNLNPSLMKLIDAHLKECKSCQNKVREDKYINEVFDKLPNHTPSEKLRSNFYAMLEDKKEKQEFASTRLKSYLYIAAAICLMVTCFYFGKHQSDKVNEKRIAKLDRENKEYKKQTLLALVDSKSVSQRINGIKYCENLDELSIDIIEVLLDRIRYDDNVNVKLASLDVLNEYPNIELVREALLGIIDNTDRIEVQLGIMKVLVNFNELRAVNPMRKILETKDLPKEIKEQIETNISTLI